MKPVEHLPRVGIAEREGNGSDRRRINRKYNPLVLEKEYCHVRRVPLAGMHEFNTPAAKRNGPPVAVRGPHRNYVPVQFVTCYYSVAVTIVRFHGNGIGAF